MKPGRISVWSRNGSDGRWESKESLGCNRSHSHILIRQVSPELGSHAEGGLGLDLQRLETERALQWTPTPPPVLQFSAEPDDNVLGVLIFPV